jgi:hypothetical protein
MYLCNSKLDLLMESLSEFYKNKSYILQIKDIIEQNSIISLRILDWFITNYSKKLRTIIKTKAGEEIDVYIQYKLMLKSFSKKAFDPFCRKNKIVLYYTEDEYIETSCGQLCFFKWCFEYDILDYVKANFKDIEKDMKSSIRQKKHCNEKKRQPLSFYSFKSTVSTNCLVKFD